MPSLRPYQAEAKSAIHAAFKRGLHGVTIEMATGTGKGNLITDIAKDVISRGKRVLIAVNRDNLCEDLHDRLCRVGLHPRMEKGMEKASSLSDLVVASIQTTQGQRLQKWRQDHFGLIITDEVHFAAAATFKRTLDHFQSAHHIGTTATLERHDKKGLWKGYQENVYSYPLKNAWEDGWLVPLEFEELPVPIQISDELATKRQFTAEDEEGVFEKNEYLPRLFAEAASRSHDKKALFFWPNIRSSQEAAKHFREHGLESAHVDGELSRVEQNRILEWFATPSPKCLHNADLLSYGYDNPSIDLVGIMRLSRSIPMLKQRIGRGTRALCRVDEFEHAEDRRYAIETSAKPHCHILDLMIQLGDVRNTFADSTALITDDEQEREFLREQRQKTGVAFTAEELENKLKVKRKTDEEKALAKLAEDAANAAMRAMHKKVPYVGHILAKPVRAGWAVASHKQMEFLSRLGYNGIAPSGWHASRIIDVYLEAKKK